MNHRNILRIELFTDLSNTDNYEDNIKRLIHTTMRTVRTCRRMGTIKFNEHLIAVTVQENFKCPEILQFIHDNSPKKTYMTSLVYDTCCGVKINISKLSI